MKENSLVSIIMATYNRAHFIVETLQSIQNQIYQNWECLIIDDGGTDNTLEVITLILGKDNRFQYLKRPNKYLKGLSGCRNYGLDIAKGDYVIFYDDDDIVHPQNVEFCVKVLENNLIDFCHYQKEPFYKELPSIFNITSLEINGKLNFNKIEKIVKQEIGLASCTIMWKRECFKNQRFNEMLQYAEEWELFNRLISEKLNGVIINNVLYFNRKHMNSNTGEFYNNNVIRIESKKEAIRLVTQNMVNKKLMTPTLLKYLAGLAITFRDINLLDDILRVSNITLKNKLYLKLKFILFPFWKSYKRAVKK